MPPWTSASPARLRGGPAIALAAVTLAYWGAAAGLALWRLRSVRDSAAAFGPRLEARLAAEVWPDVLPVLVLAAVAGVAAVALLLRRRAGAWLAGALPAWVAGDHLRVALERLLRDARPDALTFLPDRHTEFLWTVEIAGRELALGTALASDAVDAVYVVASLALAAALLGLRARRSSRGPR